jgi:hypothetical protein
VHLVENPAFPSFLHGHEVLITTVLLLVLGGVFLIGFSEAIGVAIPLVAIFLVLNAAIVVVGAVEVFTEPGAIGTWVDRLTENGSGFADIAGPAGDGRCGPWCWSTPRSASASPSRSAPTSTRRQAPTPPASSP